MDIAKWCDRIITWTFAMLFVLVPFVMTSVNYELFEYNKMMVVYAGTVIITAAWIIKMLHEREIRIAKTPLDIPIAIFFISQLIASVFSMDPHVSWFGYYSRFNGGMISIISYILLYYAFVSNWSNWSHVTHLLKILLGAALVVSLYGLLEHFGFSISCLLFTGKFDVSCWVQDVQNRVFATLGQPNWLAAYLVALIPISTAFAIKKGLKQIEFWVWTIVGIVFFTTLLFTKSRSGLLAAAVSDVVFWGLIFIRPRLVSQGEALRNFVILHVALAAIIFFFGTNVDALDKFITWESVQHRLQATKVAAKPSPADKVKTDTLLSTGGTESGVIRTYVWQAAITAWQSSVKTFLIGTGTETFAFAFYKFKPQAHNVTSEWDFLYNKAHNEYLNYLTTTGILGLGSCLFFIGAFIWWFIKQISNFKFLISKQIPNSKSQLGQLEIRSIEFVLPAVFAGWISILVTNFFGFSVVIMQLFLFLFPAMIMVSIRHEETFTRFLKVSPSLLKTIYGIVLALGIILLYFLGRLWIADTLYAKGYQLHRFGKVMDAKNYLSGAIDQNPTEPIYYDEDSVILAELAAASLEARDATGAAILAKQSLTESDKAIGISPNNVIFWKTRTKIFAAFSPFDPAFTTAAIESLKHAYTLSPTDPKILYTLAVLYGRLLPPDNQKAIEALKTAIQLKPNYRDAYALLIFYYKDTKRPDLEKQIIQEYLTKVDPQDKEFLQTLQAL